MENFNGEIPLEQLKSKEVDKVKETRVKQILAQQNDIESYMNYTDFKGKLKAENIRRKAAHEKGEPIYGPVQYDERVYYWYVLGNMEEALRNKLGKTSLAPTQGDEEAYYADNQNQFQNPQKIHIDRIAVTFPTQSDSTKLQTLKDQAQKLAEQILTEVGKGISLADAAKTFNNVNGMQVTYENQVMNQRSRMADERIESVLTAAQSLPIGH